MEPGPRDRNEGRGGSGWLPDCPWLAPIPEPLEIWVLARRGLRATLCPEERAWCMQPKGRNSCAPLGGSPIRLHIQERRSGGAELSFLFQRSKSRGRRVNDAETYINGGHYFLTHWFPQLGCWVLHGRDHVSSSLYIQNPT